MRILVCGGRDYKNWEKVHSVLDDLRSTESNIIEIIHGDAKGADSWANDWAIKNYQPRHVYPAQWDIYGKPAGVIRNRAMLSCNPELVIAFPGGKGTANMVKIAKEAGIEVKEIKDV